MSYDPVFPPGGNSFATCVRCPDYRSCQRAKECFDPCARCPWRRACTQRRACWHVAVADEPVVCGACPWDKACTTDGRCWRALQVPWSAHRLWDGLLRAVRRG